MQSYSCAVLCETFYAHLRAYAYNLVRFYTQSYVRLIQYNPLLITSRSTMMGAIFKKNTLQHWTQSWLTSKSLT
jgi:hypothetical protein